MLLLFLCGKMYSQQRLEFKSKTNFHKEKLISEQLAFEIISLGNAHWNLQKEASSITNNTAVPLDFDFESDQHIYAFATKTITPTSISIKPGAISSRLPFKVPDYRTLNLKYLNTLSGLPSDIVLSLCEDEKGNIWAATEQGIYKITGSYIHFYNYKQQFPDFDPEQIIAFNGKIYIATFGQGLFVLENNVLKIYNIENGFFSNHIISFDIENNDLYLCYYGNGIIKLNKNNTFSQFAFTENPSESIVLETRKSPLGRIALNDKNEVYLFDETSKRIKKLIVPNISSNKNIKIAANTKQLYIHIPKKGLILLTSDEASLLDNLYVNEIDQLYLAKSGTLWTISNNQMLMIRNNHIITKFENESYLQNIKITSFFQDKFSNLWLASYNKGIGIISPSNFSVVHSNPNSAHSIKTIFIDSNKNIITEYYNKGLLKTTPSNEKYVLTSDHLKSITKIVHYKNKLFIATLNGLYYIENNALYKLNITKDDGLNTHINLSVYDDGLLINNYNYGLLFYKNDTLKVYENFSTHTSSSHIDNNKSAWIATSNKGVAIFDQHFAYHIGTNEGLISNQVLSISSNNTGDVYIGTSRGLELIRNDSIFSIPLPFRFSENIINCLYNMHTATLWVSNGTEMFALNIEKNNYTYLKYNKNDIIASNQIQINSFLDDEKDMYFSSGNQLLKYTNYTFNYQTQSIPIELISFSVKNTSKNQTFFINPILSDQNTYKNIELEAGNYDLSLSIDIKNWGKEENISYYYNIKEWGDNWTGPITNNMLAINNLSPGNYTIEIKGESSDTAQIVSLNIHFNIANYFYQSTWFLLLCTSIVFVLIYLLIVTYSSFDFRSFESYTSLNEVLVKIRLLSIFSIILFPIVEFYECIYLELYPFNWQPLSLVLLTAVVALAYSFYNKINYKGAYGVLITSYVIIYTIYVLKAFYVGFSPSLSVEIALIILFSKIVFTELRNYIFFAVYATLFSYISHTLWHSNMPPPEYFNIYVSSSINTAVIVLLMHLIDYNSKRNILFANKILESTDLFVLVCDKNGNIIYLNEYLLKTTQQSEYQLLGQGWWKYRKFEGKELEEVIKKVASLIEKGQSDSYINNLTIGNVVLNVEWNDYVLNEKYLIGIGKDVTKEYALNKQNEQLSLVAKSVTNGVVIANNNGVVQWVNESFEALFDTQFDKIMGKNIVEIFNPNKETNAIAQEELLKHKSFEIHFKSNNSVSRWLLINTTPIYDNNYSILSYISVVTNISKRKKLETKLTQYADDLELNNLLKEQLIYSNDYKEISSVSLSTIMQKISVIKVGTLLLLNKTKTTFTTYIYQNHQLTTYSYKTSDIKALEQLEKNEIYIEQNLESVAEENRSISDQKRIKEFSIISYIELPIIYQTEFIGILGLEFECEFPLDDKQIDLLKSFAKLLSVALHKIQIQQDLVSKNKDITDSLNYAKSIQTSYLPQKEELKNIFKDFVLYYKPKDIVSGDFYWIENLPNYAIIALGDCTGHGVPGAFITMLGHNLLNQITSELSTYSPQLIVEYVNEKIFYALNKNKDSYIKDGMELGVCVYNKSTRQLYYSGAGIDLFYFNQNTLHSIDSPKYMVGEKLHQNTMNDVVLELNGTEKFYLSSDGYKDQLGGDPRKRFSKVKYLNLLKDMKNLPSFQQSFLLNMHHQNHKGNHDQTDDILVIGFEL